jgi:hypothetical protein
MMVTSPHGMLMLKLDGVRTRKTTEKVLESPPEAHKWKEKEKRGYGL